MKICCCKHTNIHGDIQFIEGDLYNGIENHHLNVLYMINMVCRFLLLIKYLKYVSKQVKI